VYDTNSGRFKHKERGARSKKKEGCKKGERNSKGRGLDRREENLGEGKGSYSEDTKK